MSRAHKVGACVSVQDEQRVRQSSDQFVLKKVSTLEDVADEVER